MRAIWQLFMGTLTVTVTASPLAAAQSPKARPNDVNTMGGDFGLANTPAKVELFNILAKALSAPSTGGPGAQSSLTSMISTYVHQNGMGDSYDGFGGDYLIEWLQTQFTFWMIGTDSSDPNTLICRATESESVLSGLITKVLGNATRPGETCDRDRSGGSGPYKAKFTTEPSLPYRTIYAPTNPPKDVAMPVVLWGGCIASGDIYANFLTELASHGYLAITTGIPENILGGTLVSDMTRNIDWVLSNPAAKKYGTIDMTKIITAGHSCGGLEAISGSYRDPRVNMALVLNAGVPYPESRVKFKDLNKPLAYFLGAPTIDFAFKNAEADLAQMPSSVPMLFATLKDAGHLGDIFTFGGGKEGAAAIAFLDWKIKGDESKRAWFCPPNSKPVARSNAIEKRHPLFASESPLKAEGWDIQSKNGMC